jgi:hypothetical protein
MIVTVFLQVVVAMVAKNGKIALVGGAKYRRIKT